MSNRYETVREFMYLQEADTCASALRGQGFEVEIINDYNTGAGMVGPAALIKVMVPNDDAPRALQYLADIDAASMGTALEGQDAG